MRGSVSENWNDWDQQETIKTMSSYIKRATGELPEKESSKSTARFLKKHKIYKNGNKLLDVGGSCGHFLRSFINILDEKIDYTCLDIKLDFILQGQLIWKDHKSSKFVLGDCLDMPFDDSYFDIVFVNLFHFFPDIKKALFEALRVSKKYVIWRTPICEKANYLVKYYFDKDFEELGELSFDRNDLDYCIYNIFTEKYLRGMINKIGGEVVVFERDQDFEEFDNTKLDMFSDQPSTKVVGNLQVNGSLILDWHYIAIKKK